MTRLWPSLEPLNVVIPLPQQIGDLVGRDVPMEVMKLDQHGRSTFANSFAAAYENIVLSSFHVNLYKIWRNRFCLAELIKGDRLNLNAVRIGLSTNGPISGRSVCGRNRYADCSRF